jgi:HlyD family secretion protein
MLILEKMIENVDNQKKGEEDELKYFEEKSKTNEILYKSGTIARDEYNTVQANYVAKKNTLMQFVSTKLSYRSQINQKRRDLMELDQQAKNQRSLFIESLHTLKSQFDEWINKYIIKAPIGGTLIFTSYIQESQLIQVGKPIGMINPEGSENYIEMYISQQVYPKVKLNQEVILKFQAYPIQDYGYIKGNIKYISSILNDSSFLVKVNCNKGFVTSQKIRINMKHGMTGVGEIIIKDKTIMGRLISKLTERFNAYP